MTRELLEKVLELQEAVEKRRRESERAQGRIDQILSQTHRNFDCESLEEIDKLLAKKRKELKKCQERLGSLVQSFEERFGGRL